METTFTLVRVRVRRKKSVGGRLLTRCTHISVKIVMCCGKKRDYLKERTPEETDFKSKLIFEVIKKNFFIVCTTLKLVEVLLNEYSEETQNSHSSSTCQNED